jgi:signal transduction histidine kinase
METISQLIGPDRRRSQLIGRAGYFASVFLAGVLLVAGLAVYSHGRLNEEVKIQRGWQGYLPMVAMAYGSLLLLAVAIIEVRVRHVRVGVLDTLMAHMTQAQEQERHELSGRLHDNVGALLTALKMEIEGLQRQHQAVGSPEWERVDNLLAGVLDEVRGLSALLYPRMIGRMGLKPALEELTERLCAGKLDVSLNVSDAVMELTPDQSLCMLRVVQESIINVCRHANAHAIRIEIESEGQTIKGLVADDGKGWQHSREGMGLTLMRERIRKFGGMMSVVSVREGGAGIRFEMPVTASKVS